MARLGPRTRLANLAALMMQPAKAAPLSSSPFGGTLVQEGVHAFAKIAAHVAHQNQIAVFLPGDALLDAAERFLGGAQSKRRLRGDGTGELARAVLQSGVIGEHFAEQADGVRLGGLD